ncbi:hypothetical protein [Mesorhizobium sp. M1322]|uniref:hypothetical protein n=1 Tax=Mesorhizobium sp. M1322 TaxID=2957081 RepID=UPI00333BFB91
MILSFNEFDRAFQQLEHWLGNDASRIEMLVKNSPDARRVVGSLFFWERAFEMERANGRYLRNVPSWFIERYKLYREVFADEVSRVYDRLYFHALFPGADEQVDGIPASEILNPGGRPPNKTPNSAKPLDAAQSVDTMVQWIWDVEEGLREGVIAYEWFTHVVGIDLAKIEERWDTLPKTLVPSHMEGAVPEGVPGALIALLDDATKAYVFGLPAAAIAMCRAVVERVLKEFYLTEEESRRKNGKGKMLGELLPLAEKRYEHVRRLGLNSYVAKANDVLHHYEGGRVSEDELEAVRQFIETTKTLIELAQPRPIRT